jgi:hemerythrin-like metal-binding protein
MPLFIWKPSYELNVPEIDVQHRRLVGLINELYEAMKDARGQDVLNHILDELQEYIQKHFETEERCMKKHAYPELDAHKAEHLRLGSQVLELSELRHHENKIPTPELMSFLCTWLREHLAGTDKKFGQFLESSR